MVINKITQKENEALRAFNQLLVSQLGKQVLQVILFGSKARGDSALDSDIDLLILAEDENPQLRKTISKISSQIGLDYDVCLGALLIAQKRWEQMTSERFSLCRNIERDGILLFRSEG